MVFVGDKKYACETCIKGHRSSTCKHTDRPLYEIKKKGRPVTQCEHCRELRKTKQVHVKCICSTREDGEGLPKRGSTKVPVSAAFPSGLPEELGMSIALQALTDGSDSESSHASSALCTCNDTGVCNCCTARVARKRKGKARERRGSAETRASLSVDTEPQITQPAGLVVTANTGDYRPVLPRPSAPPRQVSPLAPIPEPPSTPAPAQASSPRHQTHHGQMFYSPYGRAYEFAHGSEYAGELDSSAFQDALSSMLGSSASHPDPAAVMSDIPPAWLDALSALHPNSAATSPAVCGCGTSCACPGCLEHRGRDANPAAECSDPAACMSCLDCAVLSLPATLPDSAQPGFEAPQIQNIDDWLRQMSSMITPSVPQSLSPFSSPSAPSPTQASSPDQTSFQQPMQYDPSMLQTYALWSNLHDGRPSQAAPEECCGGRCKCPVGLCACAADCCGCCQGCQCPECEHEEPNRTLTFATSGERAPCCGSGHLRQTVSPVVAPIPTTWDLGSPSGSNSQNVGWNTESLTVPRTTLSRASSRSSQSSAGHSHASTSSSLGSALGSSKGMHANGSCCSSTKV